KYLNQSLIDIQLQCGLKHTEMIDKGLQVNMNWGGAYDRDGSILDYSRLNDMTIQAWSPFQYGHFEGVYIDHPDFPALNEQLQTIADKQNVSKSAVAVAWILRHTAQIQPIIVSMNSNRITQISTATEVVLTKEEWYSLYKAAGNELP